MSEDRWSPLWAALGFCLSGIVLLLFNFDILARFEPAAQYLLAAVAVLGGCGFFIGYASARQEWWRLIPGWTLIALAGMVVLSTVPGIDPIIHAALLFVGLSLAFVHIYLLNRQEFWWAVIPGGFMLVLGGVIALSALIQRVETLGAVLFVGMGLVFFALYGLEGRRRQWWSLIPGSILVAFGLFVFSIDRVNGSSSGALVRWWPILLVVLGLVLAVRTWRRRPAPDKLTIHAAPSRTRRSNGQPGGWQDTEQTAPAARAGIGARVRDLFPGSARRTDAARANRSTGTLGEYSRPAPGASIEVLPDPEQQ